MVQNLPDITAPINLFLCGDVMTGRGIDQILPHPGDPVLFEAFMKSARGYVELAETITGPIKRPADFSYIWGTALEPDLPKADLRIINLETAITKSNDYLAKGINYRMNPENLPCLTAAGIDCCGLANNHVLDWGEQGLLETLATLRRAGISYAGAGRDLEEAQAPAIFTVKGKARVLVFCFGTESSGIPRQWAAGPGKAGVHLLPALTAKEAFRISRKIHRLKKPGDVVIASIHWGENWSYVIPPEQKAFAHGLLDGAGVDLVHGHSSHHVKGIEVYDGKLILYGCGDFINDYEGISGYEEFRADLGLMYLPSLDPATGKILSVRLIPTRLRHFQLNRASAAEVRWLLKVLNEEGDKLGTGVELAADNSLRLKY